jgi:hypothetical protein
MLDHCLALYIGIEEMTVVEVKKVDGTITHLQTFSIPIEQEQADSKVEVVHEANAMVLIKERVLALGLADVPILLSLGCQHYHSLLHTSDFEDIKLIQQTLRFDIEGSLFVDVDELAICFKKLAMDALGTELMVYSAQRDLLTKLHAGLAKNDLDALITVPCESGWLNYLTSEVAQSRGAMIAVGRSNTSIFIAILDASKELLLTRHTLCPMGHDGISLLQCELQRCIAILPDGLLLERLYYHTEGLDTASMEALSESLSLELVSLFVPSIAKSFSIGCATGWLNEETTADFREDNLMPEIIVKERALAMKGLSFSASLLFFIMLVILSCFSYAYKALDNDADVRISSAWKTVSSPKEKVPSLREIPKKMTSKLRQIQSENVRVVNKSLSSSISVCLYELIAILNALPVQFDMTIDRIAVKGDRVELSLTTGSEAILNEFLSKVLASTKLVKGKWTKNNIGSSRKGYTITLKKKVNATRGKTGRRSRSR